MISFNSHGIKNPATVEITPSRDQLDKLPEAAIERLEETSALILQQQQVTRTTEPLKTNASETGIGRMDALARREGQLAMSAEIARSTMLQRLRFDASESFDSIMQAARRLLQAGIACRCVATLQFATYRLPVSRGRLHLLQPTL